LKKETRFYGRMLERGTTAHVAHLLSQVA